MYWNPRKNLYSVIDNLCQTAVLDIVKPIERTPEGGLQT